jgi:hypothetical protein
MAITIYNPKYYKNSNTGERTVNEAHVKRFVWSHGNWDLKVGEMKKFSDDVGQAMLRLIPFLVEVTSKNVKEIKKEAEDKAFKCDTCQFETNVKVALMNHEKTHVKEVTEEIEGVQEAVPTSTFKVTKRSKMTIEEEEGVPKGDGVDQDGVAWVGQGVEVDQSSGFTPRLGSK